MQVTPENLGFDIDCVVADTMEAFIRLADKLYGFRVSPEEITDFMVEDCLDIPPRIIDEIFAKLMLDPLAAGLRPMENAISTLEEFARQGPLSFITARPEAGPIAEWLRVHLSPTAFKASRLVATGNHDDKAEHIRTLGLTHFIDDRAITCNLLAEKTNITPIIYDQPWNFGRHTHFSVSNWQGIRKLCHHN